MIGSSFLDKLYAFKEGGVGWPYSRLYAYLTLNFPPENNKKKKLALYPLKIAGQCSFKGDFIIIFFLKMFNFYLLNITVNGKEPGKSICKTKKKPLTFKNFTIYYITDCSIQHRYSRWSNPRSG